MNDCARRRNTSSKVYSCVNCIPFAVNIEITLRPGSKVATPLPENFTPDMVTETAKETCRNWFYKIASIRELVPRLYVETAILRSYSFLTSREYSAALLRLTRMVRGIGDPLVAAYARCYLCRVGISVQSENSNKDYLLENFYDYLATYNQVWYNFILVLKRYIFKKLEFKINNSLITVYYIF